MVKHYLADALIAQANLKPISFHMPGHKYGKGLPARFLHMCDKYGLGRYDVTELPGLDVLHYPTGVIKQSQQQYADFFKLNSVHYLVNGSSAGIMAAMLSVLGPGDQVLVPRNCHSSVMHGLVLSGACPVYYYPEIDSDTGLLLGVSPQRLEALLGDAKGAIKAVVVLNPNYYGVCSDLVAINAHCQSFGAVMIVDEAHGSLFPYSSGFPTSGLEIKAPLVIQSLHKTAGALTQCSIIGTGIEGGWSLNLEQALRMVQTTSPSYLLMASIEAALCQLIERGTLLAEDTLSITRQAKDKLQNKTKVELVQPANWDKSLLDGSRLLISARHLGYSGFALADFLQQHQIFVEMADDNLVVLMLSWSNTAADVDLLVTCLSQLVKGQPLNLVNYKDYLPSPKLVMTPREAWYASKEKVKFNEALGRVAAQVYAPCPPGIPIIVPGEEVTEATLTNLPKLDHSLEIDVVARG